MLSSKRFTVKLDRDPGLAVAQILQWQVCRVAAVAPHQGVVRGGLDSVQHYVELDAAPYGVELAPAGHAVNVDRDLLDRQSGQLAPGPLLYVISSRMVKVHMSSGTRGVGPAESTGKSPIRY